MSKLLGNVILLDITNLETNNIKESGFLIFYIPLEIILANDIQMHGTLRIPWKPFRTLGGDLQEVVSEEISDNEWADKDFFFFFGKKRNICLA